MMDNICSSCAYLIYDEDYEEYICDCQMDEDDYSRMIQGNYRGCPYYRNGDEVTMISEQKTV